MEGAVMKGIILHGGAGTRLRPLTFAGPKQLIPVANKPISQYVLEDLRDSGVKDIAIVLGNVYPEKVVNHYSDGAKFGVKITYIYQGEPKGIAHAIGLCKDFVDRDEFIVYLGDNLFQNGIRKYLQEFQRGDHDCYIILKEVEDPSRFGVAKFDDNRRLVDVVEKPKQPPSNYAITGAYFFKPVVFDMIKQLKPSWRGEYEITDAIRLMIQNGYKVGYGIYEGWWFDTGKKDDILFVNSIILDERIKPDIRGEIVDSKINGRVIIDEGTRVVKSTIRGPCIIGKNCKIENSYIGPYTSIGDNTEITDSSIEYSIILDQVSVKGVKRLVESIIGSNAKILKDMDVDNIRIHVGDYSEVIL